MIVKASRDKIVKNLILRLRDEGATVFITTHNMTVANDLCDRVAFIIDGSIRIQNDPNELKKKYGRRAVTVTYQSHGDIIEEEFPMDDLGKNDSFINLLQSVERMESFHSQETTLEDVFIKVTGEELV